MNRPEPKPEKAELLACAQNLANKLESSLKQPIHKPNSPADGTYVITAKEVIFYPFDSSTSDH